MSVGCTLTVLDASPHEREVSALLIVVTSTLTSFCGLFQVLFNICCWVFFSLPEDVDNFPCRNNFSSMKY